MPPRIDFADFDRRATQSTRGRLQTLTTADLDRPSGCAGWDIRALLSHLVGGNIRFAQALRGERVDWPTRDAEPVASPLGEFDSSGALMAAAIAGIEDPKRPTLLQAGEPPAYFAVGVHAADMLVHGWDVAVATGQDAALDVELCAAAIDVVEKYPPSFWGPGRFFAARVEFTSAGPQDRLLSLVGRDPQRARS
jgi:uncharacterized protein (TIGR03086 family)